MHDFGYFNIWLVDRSKQGHNNQSSCLRKTTVSYRRLSLVEKKKKPVTLQSNLILVMQKIGA